MLSHSEENYLKAIWKLVEQYGSPVSTNAIAAIVQTRAASVTDMIKKLSEKKLIEHMPYKGVKLTKKGTQIATEVVRKHRLWEVFLVKELGYKWDEVHEIAEQLEHIRDESLTEKLDHYLGYPKHDPHGDPIPDKNGKLREQYSVALSALGEGDQCVITGVADHSNAFLHFLDKHDLSLGTTISILAVNEYDNAIEVNVGRRKMNLSPQVCSNLLVKKKNG